MEKKLTVQIVEDDAHIRARLVQVVDADERLILVADSASFRDAKKSLKILPDILLVDLGLPDGDGEDLIRLAVKHGSGKTKSIVFSIFGDEKRVVRAIEAGASGYLLKDTDIEDIPQAIIGMIKGHVPISPAIARHLLKRFHTQGIQKKPAPVGLLSEKEAEVLEYASKGYTAKEIAGFIGISYHTVTAHIRNIYKKLNVKSRSEAVFEAQKAGILDMGPPS